MLGLPRSLAVERCEGDVPALTERTGRKRPIPHRQAALVKKTSRAVDYQLNESFNHAVGLRPIRRAGKMQHQLVRCCTLQLESIVTVGKLENSPTKYLASRSQSGSLNCGRIRSSRSVRSCTFVLRRVKRVASRRGKRVV